jgi:hypothetical protein
VLLDQSRSERFHCVGLEVEVRVRKTNFLFPLRGSLTDRLLRGGRLLRLKLLCLALPKLVRRHAGIPLTSNLPGHFLGNLTRLHPVPEVRRYCPA